MAREKTIVLVGVDAECFGFATLEEELEMVAVVEAAVVVVDVVEQTLVLEDQSWILEVACAEVPWEGPWDLDEDLGEDAYHDVAWHRCAVVVAAVEASDGAYWGDDEETPCAHSY